MIAGFPPVALRSTRVLILGSMPGEASLRAGQYYAHPQNSFWKLMGEFFDAGATLPYAVRVRRLCAAGVALWDVLATCRRSGSLDAAIEPSSVIANNFPAFFAAHRRITHVFFNGATAERCFLRHAAVAGRELTRLRLPSTSPANAAMSYARKRRAWRAVPAALGIPSTLL